MQYLAKEQHKLLPDIKIDFIKHRNAIDFTYTDNSKRIHNIYYTFKQGAVIDLKNCDEWNKCRTWIHSIQSCGNPNLDKLYYLI
jgi:hypothetical protein